MPLVIVDQARYHEGRRLPCADISDELDAIRRAGSSDFLWIGMKDPSEETFARVSDELHLHPLAIEDSVAGVTAAVAAGVGRVIAVTTTSDARLLRDAGAHQVADSLSELISR